MASSPSLVTVPTAPAASTANLSFTVNDYDFSESTKTLPDIYINSLQELGTKQVDLTSFTKDAATSLFNAIDAEFIGDIGLNPHIKWGKTDAKSLESDFLVYGEKYYILITAHILHQNIFTSGSAGIPLKNSVVIKFGPYAIPALKKVVAASAGGGRRRTKISKRHSTYRTRKNKK